MKIKKYRIGMCGILPLLFCLCGGSNNDEKTSSSIETLINETQFKGVVLFHSNMDGDNEIYSMTSDGLANLETRIRAWSNVPRSPEPGGPARLFECGFPSETGRKPNSIPPPNGL